MSPVALLDESDELLELLNIVKYAYRKEAS